MDHREAKGLLLEYSAGELDQSTHDAVTAHTEECVDCRAWLETYDLLARASDVETREEHLDSEIQALRAVFPEEKDELGTVADREHLDSCAVCRQELNQVRDAVLDARSEIEYPTQVAPPESPFRWWQAVAAACVIAVAVKVIVPFTSVYFDSDVTRPDDIAVKVEEAEQPRNGNSGAAISEEEIAGTRIIQADGSLTLSDVKIMDGARVTIRANDVVAFGNGFQVGRQTELTVGATDGRPTRIQ